MLSLIFLLVDWSCLNISFSVTFSIVFCLSTDLLPVFIYLWDPGALWGEKGSAPHLILDRGAQRGGPLALGNGQLEGWIFY